MSNLPNLLENLNPEFSEKQKKIFVERIESLRREEQSLLRIPRGTPRASTGNPSAVDYNEFVKLVYKAIEQARETEKLAYDLVYCHTHPDTQAFKDILKPDVQMRGMITFRLLERRPGLFQQSNNASNKGSVREYVPHLRDSFPDPENPGHITWVYGQFFDNTVEFTVWAKTNQVADDLSIWFEDFMQRYTWFFKQSGVGLVRYEGRSEDVFLSENNEKVVGRPMSYYVRTERITHTSSKALDRIILDLQLGE